MQMDRQKKMGLLFSISNFFINKIALANIWISFSCSNFTMAKTEMIHQKTVGASVAMNFTYDKYWAPMAIKRIKILGALLELPNKQHCQSSPFTSKLGQIGQIGSVV